MKQPAMLGWPFVALHSFKLVTSISTCINNFVTVLKTCDSEHCLDWMQISGDLARPIDCLQLSHNDLLVVQKGPPVPAAPASAAPNAALAEVQPFL